MDCGNVHPVQCRLLDDSLESIQIECCLREGPPPGGTATCGLKGKLAAGLAHTVSVRVRVQEVQTPGRHEGVATFVAISEGRRRMGFHCAGSWLPCSLEMSNQPSPRPVSPESQTPRPGRSGIPALGALPRGALSSCEAPGDGRAP